MKFSQIFPLCVTSLSAALILSLSACNSGSSSKTSSSPVPYGNENPPGVLPDLTANYRPRSLSHKVFESDSKIYAPMDFQTQNLSLTFDVSAQTIRGHSRIVFQMTDTGRPYFQLKGNIENPTLDGVSTAIGTVFDPDRLGNSFYSIEQEVGLGTERVFEFDYTLPNDRVTFADGGVRFLTDMSDLGTPQYFEMWGPAGFEDDAFEMKLHLNILNSAGSYLLFSNGSAVQDGSLEWTVSFPNYFTTSSFYVHLSNHALNFNQFTIHGLEKEIPVTVYSENEDLVAEASGRLPALFAELEKDYGPYAHSQFVAYIQGGGGGMEYVGATITSIGAMDHELFHSWFARGVMPAEGRSGWIDEGLASWRDYGYFQAGSLLERTPTNLSDFSPFRISTPSNCYRDGRNLIAELDRFLAQFGGMKPLLRSFFHRYKYRVVTTEEFQAFLSLKTEKDVSPFFQRYAFANNTSAHQETDFVQDSLDRHPRSLSREEVLRLR